MVITHVNSEVTCIVEGILRGKFVAYRAPIDHIRPFYDIHLENIPAMKRDDDIEEENEKEKDKREKERGKEGEESETDEDEEEEVNFTTCVNPSRTDLPVIKTITMKNNEDEDEKNEQDGKGEEENTLALSLLDLPESELICIDPEIELAIQGESVDNIKEKIREGSHMEEGLLFHKILPFTTMTRKQKIDLDKELHEEYLLMSTRPGSPEETRSPQTEGMDLEWWGEGGHHPEEREEEKEEKEEEEGHPEEERGEEERTEEPETNIQDESEEREWNVEVPRDTQDQEKDEEQEEREEERTEEEEEPVREEEVEGEKEKEDTEGEKEMPIVEENPQKRVKKIIKEKWVTRTNDKADNKTDEDNKTDNKTDEDNKTDNKTDEDKDKTLFGKMARMGKRLKGHNKEGDYWKIKGATRRRKE